MKDFYGVSSVVLPSSTNDAPRVQRLVFASEKLHVKKVDVVVEKDYKVEFAVWCDDGERTT
jgi:hypothetical protein